jgi:hypothetical protein
MMRRWFIAAGFALCAGAACGPADPGYTPSDAAADAKKDGGTDAGHDGGIPDLAELPDQAID